MLLCWQIIEVVTINLWWVFTKMFFCCSHSDDGFLVHAWFNLVAILVNDVMIVDHKTLILILTGKFDHLSSVFSLRKLSTVSPPKIFDADSTDCTQVFLSHYSQCQRRRTSQQAQSGTGTSAGRRCDDELNGQSCTDDGRCLFLCS